MAFLLYFSFWIINFLIYIQFFYHNVIELVIHFYWRLITGEALWLRAPEKNIFSIVFRWIMTQVRVRHMLSWKTEFKGWPVDWGNWACVGEMYCLSAAAIVQNTSFYCMEHLEQGEQSTLSTLTIQCVSISISLYSCHFSKNMSNS